MRVEGWGLIRQTLACLSVFVLFPDCLNIAYTQHELDRHGALDPACSPIRQISTVASIDGGSVFALRRSTLDLCLGGQRFREILECSFVCVLFADLLKIAFHPCRQALRASAEACGAPSTSTIATARRIAAPDAASSFVIR